jgi:hypothetical protein
VTASFAQPESAPRRKPTTASTVVVGVVAGMTVVTLLIAGLTFVGLAIAFPIALPVATAYHLPVSAADSALAERLASIWFVFVGLAIASFAAAAVLVVKVIGFLSPASRD